MAELVLSRDQVLAYFLVGGNGGVKQVPLAGPSWESVRADDKKWVDIEEHSRNADEACGRMQEESERLKSSDLIGLMGWLLHLLQATTVADLDQPLPCGKAAAGGWAALKLSRFAFLFRAFVDALSGHGAF